MSARIMLHGLIFLTLLTIGCKPSAEKAGTLPPEVTSLAGRKEAQARELAERFHMDVSPDIWRYFAAAKKGDLEEVLKRFEGLQKRAGQYKGSKSDPRVTGEVWQTVLETHLACEQFGLGEPKYARAFGEDIIKSIPPGSIYFGGTDPGRGLVTALCERQENGEPFFTLTQNALADGHYLHYLEVIYGNRFYVPSGEDSQRAFEQYLTNAQVRLAKGKLRPGEDVKIVNNRVQVSGQVAVMEINALLAKVIFEKNTNREFFIEESFPLDWMYPHLAPHGLIMAIRREPMPTISVEDVEKDTNFWNEWTAQMIGDWLKPNASVREVCDFVDKVFSRKDLSGFRGDPKFVANTNACAMFSKLRSSIAGVYAWHAGHTTDPRDQRRMTDAADFGFRQAYALCPYSTEAIFRYINLLTEDSRPEDALLVARTALKVLPQNDELKEAIQKLEKTQGETKRQ